MADEATGSSTTTAAAPASAPSTTAAPASSVSTSTQQTSGGVKAAYAAATAGGGPKAVEAAMSGGSADPGSPNNAAPTTAPTAPETAKPSDSTYGLDASQIQALKRAQKFDPARLERLSPDDRTEYANAVKEWVANRDRAYQLGKKAPAAPEGGTQKVDANANPPTDATQPIPPDQQDGQPPAPTEPFIPRNAQQISDALIAEMDRTSAEAAKPLADLVGEDVAQQFTDLQKAQSTAFAQVLHRTVEPLQNIIFGLAQRLEDRDFSEALGAQSKLPGFEKLANDPDLSAKVRAEATRRIGALRDPGYGFKQAIAESAASLLNVDPGRMAQVQLAQRSAPFVSTSGARPTPRLESPRPQTPAEQAKRAWELAKSKMSGKDIATQLAMA